MYGKYLENPDLIRVEEGSKINFDENGYEDVINSTMIAFLKNLREKFGLIENKSDSN